ncbi:hypothetical protein GRI38_07200 [Altererythrobacter aurantiacus]|uniref:Uncharacterized protein n=1 Tax=Parapontixanthobacter aurantiacus TaxID=1463599 RepID=A0A844ZFS5_9SPHN|nr:hypothetical protein [Parapontixanthobacter aurantiacus]MXO85817.1 hypothetical protein [Parapontixanthobacter aurantiacus]
MTRTDQSTRPRIWKRAFAAFAGLFVLTLFLAIDASPDTPVQQAPTARDVEKAQSAFRAWKSAQAEDAAPEIAFDNAMLTAAGVLISDGTGYERASLSVKDGVARGTASIALPFGLWLNGSAGLTGEHRGFPEVDAQVGSLPIPSFLVELGARTAYHLLRRRGANLRPFDDLVQHIAIERETVVASLAIPSSTGLVQEYVQASGTSADPRLTQALYCRAIEAQKREGFATLPELVRVVFTQSERTSGDVAHNRAALAALALFVVPGEAQTISPALTPMLDDCGRPAASITLRGRDDLAKHWALSAQLLATFGDDAALGLGQWKELKDSLDGGSGFSFVDLAADRSGLLHARMALDPNEAHSAAVRLSRIRQEGLLPISLMRAPEGLSEGEFVATYGTIDSRRYEAAIRTIDEALRRELR